MLTVYDVKRLREIRNELREIANVEGIRLFRMARKLEKHGGSLKLCNEIREEAWSLHELAYPERLLESDRVWKFAFR